MNKTAVILINVGTPDKPETKYVRRYLSEFLNDRRVIDMPYILQKFLVNLIIVPFRAPKSAKLYKNIWDGKSFPLLSITEKAAGKLQKELGENYEVHFAMRYGNPSLKALIRELKFKNFKEIIFVPLFPQYASSTTGSVIELIMNEMQKLNIIPKFRIIHQFYNELGFIDAFAKRISSYKPEDYEHIIFSFHSLPLDHIKKVHPGIELSSCSCEEFMPEHGKYCYKATCYETARLIADKLNFDRKKYSVAFQSRLTKNWLSPFTDEMLIDKAKSGVNRILIVSPSFVTDCLETIYELGTEYKHLFINNGGEELVLADSLNDYDEWICCLSAIICK